MDKIYEYLNITLTKNTGIHMIHDDIMKEMVWPGTYFYLSLMKRVYSFNDASLSAEEILFEVIEIDL